ncbi:MAG: hypothetical protein WC142_03960 [Bacteroidales bacterium]|jgi:hypothetical protein|nr:hypothetical protein [Bacteroidales bacterium]MDD2688031.1 hypothetical protein [Bacteroidales bacterium]MDD3330241.1 hypothetical protein [Bacteroidales bacterium]MDD3691000.1 hypothetical protein [Bacteroidales bacterium]MDD4044263.1 hypothetical protein [Bacteroidales bacterium]
MKTQQYLYLFLIFIAIIAHSCGEEGEEKRMQASLSSNEICKNNLKSADETPDSISCVEYQYNETTKTLTLVHINAGFNCCPGKLSCEVSFQNDTLRVEEFEKEASCHCCCLYDLNIAIKNIEKKSYHIQCIEPYAKGLAPLCFDINLNHNYTGNYSVIRKQYPWGINSMY